MPGDGRGVFRETLSKSKNPKNAIKRKKHLKMNNILKLPIGFGRRAGTFLHTLVREIRH